MQHADFARLSSWITLVVGQEKQENIWGIYDVPFYKDRNGNWRAPDHMLKDKFNSTMKKPDGSEFIRTIGQKFSAGMCTTWPPLGHDGALHSYSYKAWGKAVEKFGGCAPTSMCEDMLFYRLCQDHLENFNAVRIDAPEPLFIRCADGTNASLIEWNKEL